MINLKGQNALITGASGSIGKAIAKLFHHLGAHTYISGSNLEKLENLGQELGDRYTIKTANLADVDSCYNLLNDIEKLHILVCNAGITRDNLAIRMKEEDFTQVIAINLTANFILNKEAVKKMIPNRYGRIINIASVVGVSGNPGQTNYCASKAGLIGMSKALAAEVASRNITVNIIAPGFVTSNMTNNLTAEQQDTIKQKIPARNFGTAEDVAGAVAFLASSFASYITGHTLHINGGMLMV